MAENKEEKQTLGEQTTTYPHVTDVKQTPLNDDGHLQKLTSTDVKPTKSARVSAHSLRWTWNFEGKTQRKPDKTRRMRGWTGKIYYRQNCTIILNVNTMELYTHSRPYKSTEKMIYATWSRADRIAREFSKEAQIAIRPIHSDHPGDLQTAHLVVNRKDINQKLLPGKANSEERRKYIGKDVPYHSAVRVGAIEDGSHPGKVELKGKESAEGGLGLDWLLLDYPEVVRQSLEMNARFSKNLELHLKVLQDMRKTLKEIREGMK